ncbi:hypothetical protein TrLO_g16009 [Triparma laevis f. longispina]|uniref:EF-hand domain-containing protein n=1 Tax=Triparma laevis f. longispina TaxID=1714387 RepID=A0A9W7E356_9STRA|nr:hypothetical protein TrLO_g16009 [Triparma laevis f. longispina]
MHRTLPHLRTFRLTTFNDCYTLQNLPRLTTYLASNPSDAVVLAGDFLSPSTLSSIDFGIGMISTLRASGVTHLSLGNHEADFKLPLLSSRLKSFNKTGKILNSNILGLKDVTCEVDVIKKDGLSICLHGYIGDEINMFRDGTFKGLKISPVFETFQKILSTHPSISLHIPLTHQSISYDILFAKKIANLGITTIIVGGHEHEKFDDLIQENEDCVRIIKTGENCERVSVIDFKFDDVEDKLLDINVEFVEMKDYEPCPVVQKIADKHLSVLESMEETSIITTNLLPKIFENRPLSSLRTRFEQMSVGCFICSAIKLELDVDYCIINGATIKGGVIYEEGEMSYAELKKELPFPTKIVVVEMKRKVLEEAVEWSRNNIEDGSMDETHPEVEVARRGYLQVDFDLEINPVGDPEELVTVALPRNLMAGFCKIKPLIEFGKELKDKGIYPNEDSIIKAVDIVVRFCCKERWVSLSEETSFDEIDLNHDGMLDASEIKLAMARFLGTEPQDFFVEQMIEAIDEDHNGTIEIEEFKQLMAAVRRRKE